VRAPLVAVVWMLSPDVLYTPYLDVICRWNIPPLVDQRWAGLVMFVAGVPVQLVGVWLLVGSSHRNRSSDRATDTPSAQARTGVRIRRLPSDLQGS
jgi:cytochrome c oxidase assembly factor CtaG